MKPLSPQERATVTGLVAGHRVCDLARQWRLSIKTVSTFRSRALKKLGLRTNAELVQWEKGRA